MMKKRTVPIPDPAAPIPDEVQRRGQMLIHTLPILLFPFVIAALVGWFVRVFVGGPPPTGTTQNTFWQPAITPIIVLAVAGSAVILLARLGRPNLSIVLLIAAWTLVTTVSALVSGVASIGPAMLVLPICTAGLLIDGVASISLAGLATVFVILLGLLEPFGLNPRPPFPAGGVKDLGLVPMSVAFWVGLYWTVAALTFLSARGLKSALDQSRMQARALQELSAQLEERVATQTAELLAQEREAAMLEERTRVARDIHDTLAQGLTGIVVQLGAAQRALDVSPEQAAPHLDLAQRLARESLGEARRSIWNLRAPALERSDLGAALQGLAARPMHPETRIAFEQHGKPYPMPADVESTLLRVCQEALVNVAKHARATQVKIRLEYRVNSIQLMVRDNGVGFESVELAASGGGTGPWGGFGLLGMQERIHVLGGTLSLTNDAGAKVLVTVPRAPTSPRVAGVQARPQPPPVTEKENA